MFEKPPNLALSAYIISIHFPSQTSMIFPDISSPGWMEFSVECWKEWMGVCIHPHSYALDAMDPSEFP